MYIVKAKYVRYSYNKINQNLLESPEQSIRELRNVPLLPTRDFIHRAELLWNCKRNYVNDLWNELFFSFFFNFLYAIMVLIQLQGSTSVHCKKNKNFRKRTLGNKQIVDSRSSVRAQFSCWRLILILYFEIMILCQFRHTFIPVLSDRISPIFL